MGTQTDMTKLIINFAKVPKKSSVVQAVGKKRGKGGGGEEEQFVYFPCSSYPLLQTQNGDEIKAAHY